MAKKKSATYKYNYYDENGKRRCKTFSAPTAREARLKALEWDIGRPSEQSSSMTVLKAVNGYLELREAVLSPMTIKQYYSIRDKHIESDQIASVDLAKLTAVDLQAWVNHLVELKLSPKTVKNTFGFLRAAIKMYRKNLDFDSVRLPQPIRYVGHTPGDEEVQTFISHIRDRDHDLYLAVLLGAFGPMRRSEICALTSDDIKGASVYVHRAKVPARGNVWVIKEMPKTDASNRTIIFPAEVAKEFKGIQGDVIKCSPTAITKRFKRGLKKAGLPDCRFHDLRHYGASIMHAIGVPDVYIIERGGWSSDYVMKRIYRDALDDEKKKQTNAINGHFSGLINGKSEAKSEAKIAMS